MRLTYQAKCFINTRIQWLIQAEIAWANKGVVPSSEHSSLEHDLKMAKIELKFALEKEYKEKKTISIIKA